MLYSNYAVQFVISSQKHIWFCKRRAHLPRTAERVRMW